MSLPAFLLHIDTAENRTLCRARALGKRVSVFSPRARTPAGGRSRCGFAKQIRGFSAQTFDSKRMRCYRISACHAPHQRKPRTAENRTLCRARALSKREAFVASGRGRRQAAEAGADLRSKYADSPRKASTRYRRDADRTAACRVPHQRRVRRAFPMAAQAESASRNSASNWDALSAPSPQLQNLCALHPKTG